jgi:hypothetical protein
MAHFSGWIAKMGEALVQRTCWLVTSESVLEETGTSVNTISTRRFLPL